MDADERANYLKNTNERVNGLLGKIKERFGDFASNGHAVADLLKKEGFVERSSSQVEMTSSGKTYTRIYLEYSKNDLNVTLTVNNRGSWVKGVTGDLVVLHVEGDGYIAHLPLDVMSRYFEKRDAA